MFYIYSVYEMGKESCEICLIHETTACTFHGLHVCTLDFSVSKYKYRKYRWIEIQRKCNFFRFIEVLGKTFDLMSF